jgi:hypothetical protein
MTIILEFFSKNKNDLYTNILYVLYVYYMYISKEIVQYIMKVSLFPNV